MALVAYDNSDSSDYEEEDNESVTVINLIKNPGVSVPGPSVSELELKDTIDHTPEHGPNLFNLLPQPSIKKLAVVEEEDDEFLHKKEKVNVVKPKAKITVPSLRDFKDVDSPTPAPKPKVSDGRKSGLLSLLPQPRNGLTTTTSRSLMPHVLQQSKNAKNKATATKPSPAKKPKIDNNLLNSDESDDDDGVKNDFFSMHKPVDPVPIEEIPLDINQEIAKPVLSNSNTARTKLESYFKQDPVEDHVQPEPMDNEDFISFEAGSTHSKCNGEAEESSSNGDIVIDEEAILKLCGTRGKRRREDIQIVDVNQQEVLADAREWLLKGLMDDTTKRVSASKKKGNEPTSQQKRKHQITYLAHQAKANEAELQNQWANSRMSRRQTQNKYGF